MLILLTKGLLKTIALPFLLIAGIALLIWAYFNGSGRTINDPHYGEIWISTE